VSRPQIVLNFDVNTQGRFPREMPDDVPTVSNVSTDADAFNVSFEPILIGNKRVRFAGIARVPAGGTSPVTVSVCDEKGDHYGRNLAATVLYARLGAIANGIPDPTRMQFVTVCRYQDFAGTYYETESVIEWSPLRITAKLERSRAL